MSDAQAAEPKVLTDEAILERFLHTRNQPTGSKTLGFRMVSVNQAMKCVEVEFDAKAELLLNPMKQIQGGYLCAMLDECMSVACMVASGMTAVAPTLEMKTSFLRPGKPGKIAEVRKGRLILDGDIISPANGEAIVMRRRLAQNGLVIVVLGGKGSVQIESLGLPLEEDHDDFVAEAQQDVAAALAKLKGGQRQDREVVLEAARLAARRAAQRWCGKKPQVRVIMGEG